MTCWSTKVPHMRKCRQNAKIIIDLLLAGFDHWGGRRVVTRSVGLGLGLHEGGDNSG